MYESYKGFSKFPLTFNKETIYREASIAQRGLRARIITKEDVDLFIRSLLTCALKSYELSLEGIKSKVSVEVSGGTITNPKHKKVNTIRLSTYYSSEIEVPLISISKVRADYNKDKSFTIVSRNNEIYFAGEAFYHPPRKKISLDPTKLSNEFLPLYVTDPILSIYVKEKLNNFI